MPEADVLQTLRQSLNNPGRTLGCAFTRSAVVVPLLKGDQGVEIVFELRAGHLRRSPGEVGFPGGRLEPGESPWQAALRELQEELGVDAGQVELLGALPEQQRSRGELIVPHVCVVEPGAALRPHSDEVEEAFTIPLDFLLRNPFQEARIIEEYSLSEDFPRHHLPGGNWKRRLVRPVYYLAYDRYLIWGLTARVLIQLLDLLA